MSSLFDSNWATNATAISRAVAAYKKVKGSRGLQASGGLLIHSDPFALIDSGLFALEAPQLHQYISFAAERLPSCFTKNRAVTAEAAGSSAVVPAGREAARGGQILLRSFGIS